MNQFFLKLSIIKLKVQNSNYLDSFENIWLSCFKLINYAYFFTKKNPELALTSPWLSYATFFSPEKMSGSNPCSRKPCIWHFNVAFPLQLHFSANNLLSDDICDYHFVSQGKTNIPGVDDGEEMDLTDVSTPPPTP